MQRGPWWRGIPIVRMVMGRIKATSAADSWGVAMVDFYILYMMTIMLIWLLRILNIPNLSHAVHYPS